MEQLQSSSSIIELNGMIHDLRAEISALKVQNTKYRATLEEVGIIESELKMTDIEAICLDQIGKLRDIAESGLLDKDEAQVFEIMHRNLKIARGENDFKKVNKAKKLTDEDLQKMLK